MNLTEATMLAIQGKLKLDESKKLKKESIDVSVDDNGATIVETPEATVIVTDTQNATEAPTEEVVVAEIPDEVETVEIPVEGDETIIPEDIVEPEVTDEPTMDEIVDGETEADEEDLEESKKPCKDCGKEKCECEKVEENKEIKTEDLDDNQFSFKFTDETQFGSLSNEDALTTLKELQQYFQQYADVIKADTLNEYIDNDYDMQVVATTLNQAIEKLNKAWLEESKKVEENVEIEVSEDGTEVEVKTDEGENVEVVDETEEPETSDEAEETASEEVVEVPEEETDEEVEDDSEFIEESFEKALTEYYKNNTKSIKGYKIEKISKDRNSIKIEGLLINKLNKSVKTELKANKVQEGKFYTRYEIANIKGLLESKTSTKGTMITKTTKESKLECTSITNKKLVK